MKKIFYQILFILLFCSGYVYPQVIQQWIQQNQSMSSGFKDIHVDASGNIYVLGKSPERDSVSWTSIASFNSSGQQRFIAVENRSCPFNEWYFDLNGNIYTAAQYTAENNSNYWSIKKFINGQKLWETANFLIDGESVKSFTGDNNGNTYLLKSSNENGVILKYNTSGTLVLSVPINELYCSYALAVDPMENIVVSGIRFNEHTASCLTTRYNQMGLMKWQSDYEIHSVSSGSRFKIKIFDNDIYVMLNGSNAKNGSDYIILKYNPDGNLSLSSYYDSRIDDLAFDFTIDNKYNVIVTGNNGTAKINKKGITVWYDTTKNMVSVTNDKLNNIYLTGENAVSSGDMLTLKFNAEGNRVWAQYFKGTNTSTIEKGLAVTIDSLLNVYCSGFQSLFPDSYNIGIVIKYKQLSADTATIKYMPLAKDNSWVYHVTSGDSSYYIRSIIKRDTIVDGKKYYYLTYFPIAGYSNWLRIDTLSGNLYAFIPSYNCDAQLHEKIIDSLVSSKLDTLRECGNYNAFITCIDTGNVSFNNRAARFKQFKSSLPLIQTRCYARGIGIYTVYRESVTPVVAQLKGCVINETIFGDTLLRYSVSGKVMYKDNHQPVTSGTVKALKYNLTTGHVEVVDTAMITSTGTYRLNNVVPDSCDIMAYQDDEIFDIVPGFRDSTIYWQSANTLTAGPGSNNIDIYVERALTLSGSHNVLGHIYSLNTGYNSLPLENTRIYLKSGNEFRSFNISDSTGRYSIDSIEPGMYTFIVDRIGYYPQIRQVDLTSGSIDTVNFYLQKYSGVERDITLVPAKYSLVQNYPNPFNPSTTFTFDIPSTADVKLIIYDITGREICKLVDKKLNTGRYKINWDATSYASGVYLYRLEAGDLSEGNKPGFSETKKLVLMK